VRFWGEDRREEGREGGVVSAVWVCEAYEREMLPLVFYSEREIWRMEAEGEGGREGGVVVSSHGEEEEEGVVLVMVDEDG